MTRWPTPRRPMDPVAASALGELDQHLAAAVDRGHKIEAARIRNTAAEIARSGIVDPINEIRMRMHRRLATPAQNSQP